MPKSIDLIIERADNVLHICEIKFVVDKFAIDKAYSKYTSRQIGNLQVFDQNKKDTILDNDNYFWTCKK